MYDLKPVRLSLRSKFVQFTNEMEEQLSPQRRIEQEPTLRLRLRSDRWKLPSFSAKHGTSRLPSRPLAKPVRLIIAKGYNHYEVGETIGNPYAVLGRAAMDMIGTEQRLRD